MFFLLYKRADGVVFDDFPKIYDNFPKISGKFQNCTEGNTNVSENFPTITEDCRRRPKKIRRCFDHTPLNLSVVEGTKERCFQTHVGISYLQM